MQSRALVRFLVGGLAGPPGDGEEEPDPPLAFGVAVVDDMGENEITWVDADAGLFVRLADRAAGNRLAGLQVPGR